MKINGLEMELDVTMHVNGRCHVCERQVANRQVQFMPTTSAIYANNSNHNGANGDKRRAFINHTVAGGRATGRT